MTAILRHVPRTVCAIVGLLLASATLTHLKQQGKLHYNPNVLTLKGSPYGRIIAFAMRGPVDVYWHRGQTDNLAFNEDAAARAKRQSLNRAPAPADATPHLPALMGKLKGDFDREEAEEELPQAPKPFNGVRGYLVDRIEAMRKAYFTRYGDHGDTHMHRAYIRAEVEKRLALSYEMDPTNIICYGSYFLFLSESLSRVVGTADEQAIIREHQEIARKLAENTVNFCMNHMDEAPAMITAAAAAHDWLQIHYSRPNLDVAEATRFLRFLDTGMEQFAAIRREMVASGTWENHSVQRINEMESAYAILRLVRIADHQIFERRMAAASAPEHGSNPR